MVKMIFWKLCMFLFALVAVSVFGGLNKQISAQAVETTPTANSLSEQLGFWDPALEALEGRGFIRVARISQFDAFGRSYTLVSLYSEPGGEAFYHFEVVVLCQMNGPQVHVVWQSAVYQAQIVFDDAEAERSSWPAPGSWLGDQRFFFAFYTVRPVMREGGASVHIFELAADGTVTSSLRNIMPPEQYIGSVQIDEAGHALFDVFDLHGLGRMSSDAQSWPRMRRFYDWNGTSLTDVSPLHFDSYADTLGSDVYVLTTWVNNPNLSDDGNQANYAVKVLELLAIYDALDQRAAGWKLAQTLVGGAQTAHLWADAGYLDDVFMPAMQRMFEQGKPFLPPEYEGPNPPAVESGYADD